MKKELAILIFLGLVLPFLVLAVTIENPIDADTFEELIENIITFIFNIALALVPLMIVIAGVYFVTAAGNPEQVQKAKGIILYTLIGFIVIILARGFVEFLKQIL
jgi:hypothetical protein